MVRKKIAVLLTFLLTITAQPAFADVNSYGIKANNKEFTYDKIELQQSFIANKRGDDSKLYDEFLANVQSGAFIYFQDDSGKKVDYKLIVNAFIQAKREGKNFDVDDFVENAPGIGGGEPSKPIDDHHKHDHEDKGDLFKVRSHEEMVSILKDMSDGIYKDIVVSDDIGYIHTSQAFPELKDAKKESYFSVKHYNKVIKKSEELDKEYYSKSEYGDICDLDNYMKIPNLNINFDKVNNLNVYDREINKYIKGMNGEVKEDLKLEGLKQRTIIKKSCDVWGCGYDLSKEERLFKVIWRPDMEQQVVVAINKLRESKGMRPLLVKNDLWAIARFGAKRSQFGYSKNDRDAVRLRTGCCKEQHWKPGYIPFAQPHEKFADIGDLLYKKLYTKESLLKDNANALFGYKGKIESLSWNSNFYTTGKQFIDKLLGKRYNDHVADEPILRASDVTASLPHNILDPNMKYIGVGSTHEIPIHILSKNGDLGIFVVVGE